MTTHESSFYCTEIRESGKPQGSGLRHGFLLWVWEYYLLLLCGVKYFCPGNPERPMCVLSTGHWPVPVYQTQRNGQRAPAAHCSRGSRVGDVLSSQVSYHKAETAYLIDLQGWNKSESRLYQMPCTYSPLFPVFLSTYALTWNRITGFISVLNHLSINLE